MYFRERVPIIRSIRLIEELYVFVWNGQSAGAQSGYNDDLVMALGIGFWVRDTAIRLRQEGIMSTRRSLDHITKTTSVYNSANVRDKKEDTGWTHNTGRGQEDLTWLL